MAEALREVTETANNAFRLALGAQPTIIGHGIAITIRCNYHTGNNVSLVGRFLWFAGKRLIYGIIHFHTFEINVSKLINEHWRIIQPVIFFIISKSSNTSCKSKIWSEFFIDQTTDVVSLED